MKFIFITGCMEKAKDGVGDYTRLLAFELIKLNHACSIIALTDAYIATEQPVTEEDSGLTIFRISAQTPWSQKIPQARHFIEAYGPSHISVQMVVYGYNRKGILFRELTPLVQLTKGFKTQLMLHELWVSTFRNRPLKERITGYVQRHFLLKLIRKMKPCVIHTNTQLFRFLLKKSDLNASLLPVFSNIPVSSNPVCPGFFDELFQFKDGFDRSQWIVCVIFGSIHQNCSPAAFFKYISSQMVAGKKFLLVSAGKNDQGFENWQEQIKAYQSQIHHCQLGELDTDTLSCLFRESDMGLSTYPLIFIEKSGAIAAMVEHGLPVVVIGPRDLIQGFEFRIDQISPLISEFAQVEQTRTNLTEILRKKTKIQAGHTLLGETARGLATDLLACGHKSY